MNNFNKNDLLPEGFKVLLPSEAQTEEFISRKIQDLFFSNGYLLVKTPLMEYESTELKELSQKKNSDTFILVEPGTKKIMVLRSDITSQVAKLATSKLANYHRPLRLMYAGEVFRNEKNIYQTDRQFKQIGAEVIGVDSIDSFIEVINITLEALNILNIKNITIDFSLPSISRYLEKKISYKNNDGAIIREAIENKNSSLIKNNKFKYIKGLIDLSGNIDVAKKNAAKVKFPKYIEKLLSNFFDLTNKLRKSQSKLSMTVDITEAKSFLKYENFGFKIYNKDNANAIAIGGDYLINKKESGLGITIMINKLIENINILKKNKIYIPFNVDSKTIPKRVKNKGIIIKELRPKKNSVIEAKKHKCNYIFKKDEKLHRVK